MTSQASWCGVVVGCLCMSTAAFGITAGQVDDFQDGTTMNWAEGPPSPNPPFNNADAGPAGVGDHAMGNSANNTSGAGGRPVVFNQTQWTGDYVTENVSSIDMWIRNDATSGGALLMRIAVQGVPGNQYVSTVAASVPNDGVWHQVTFGLAAGDLTQVAGGDALPVVLSSVTELRILHSTAPSWIGGVFPATYDIDNIQALPIPEPTTAAVLGLSAFAAWRGRRRTRRA